MTLPPSGGIVHLRSGLLYDGVRGLDVLDDGGVKSDRYHDFDLLFSLSLSSLASIGEHAASVSVQIWLKGTWLHKIPAYCSLSKSAHVHGIQQKCSPALAYHSLTHAAWLHPIIAQSSARVHCDRDQRQAWACPWACPAIHGGAQ